MAYRIATGAVFMAILVVLMTCGESGAPDAIVVGDELETSGRVNPPEPKTVRALFIADEKTGDRRVFRWSFEIGAGVRSYEFGILNAPARGQSSSRATLSDDDSREIEIEYVERKVTGAEVLDIISSFGNDDTKNAVLEATPGFADVFAHHVRLRVGGTSFQSVVPGSVVKEKYNLCPDSHLGLEIGKSVVLQPEKNHVLSQRMYLNMENSTFFGSLGGEYIVRVDGEKVEFKDLNSPGWQAWFRFHVD